MDRIDACVVGAGVVGLAVARALAMRGLETVVLEQADAIGTATSARNSEVIHAGIYYPKGSLKARLCVEGKALLYAHCESHGVAHARCGKLIVAASEGELEDLRLIEAKARGNGVLDLQWLSGAQARALEPALQAKAALLSPSTGIVDSHGLMLSLQGGLEERSGAVALCSPVLAVHSGADGHVVQVGGEGAMELQAGIVVNAAGLWAPGLAAHHGGLNADGLPRAGYAKGNYCALSGKSPFSRLIYPAHTDVGGLGVHLTLDLGGQARFGPDVQWIAPDTPEDIDYRVDPARANDFYAAIRRYWPALPDGALQPAYSGVRPKLQWPGEPDAKAPHDFAVQGPEVHGLTGLVNLFGIESPGLTSSLALANEVLARLGLGD